MSLFNWFSGKSAPHKKQTEDSSRPVRQSKPGQTRDKAPSAAHAPSKPATDQITPSAERRVKRHARREQLYVAIRECMTRAGVLSASYKFKVLSLDQRGDQFLVMMDVAPGLGGQAGKLTEIETVLISSAKSIYSIYVTSVYWRTDNRAAAPHTVNAVNFGVSQPAALDSMPMGLDASNLVPKKASPQRYDPIQDEEMAAFKQALAASAAHAPTAHDVAGKSRSGLRSYTLITGFEDTEMPESASSPALSATQYGELR